MKVYTNEILEKMSFIPLIFQLYFIKEIGNFVPHWKQLDNLPKSAYFTHSSCIFQADLFSSFACIFVSYYCRMLSSDNEKGESEISLIVVGASKLWQKEDDSDFHVFLSEIWKIGKRLCVNNRPIIDYWETADYRPNWLIGSSLKIIPLIASK